MQWFFMIGGIAALAYYIMRRLDYGKPKECEAKTIKIWRINRWH